MIVALLLFAVGLMLSAFFSGTETGLYRVPRVRLVLDGISGSVLARSLVWLLNRPAMFVATTLVGNNIANYLTSLAVVLGVQSVLGDSSTSAELLVPIMTSPLVFVLGELLPKYLFYYSPYLLLRLVGGPFLLMTVLLAPLSVLLGAMGQLLSLLTGEAPFRVQLAMARRELQRVFREGHEAGLLGTKQRNFAENIWEVGMRKAIAFADPPERVPMIVDPHDHEQARIAAHRKGYNLILVGSSNTVRGYVRYAEIPVDDPVANVKVYPVLHATRETEHFDLLMRLIDQDCEVAIFEDAQGQLIAVVTRRQLLESLLSNKSR